jgi:hypothetical protein
LRVSRSRTCRRGLCGSMCSAQRRKGNEAKVLSPRDAVQNRILLMPHSLHMRRSVIGILLNQLGSPSVLSQHLRAFGGRPCSRAVYAGRDSDSNKVRGTFLSQLGSDLTTSSLVALPLGGGGPCVKMNPSRNIMRTERSGRRRREGCRCVDHLSPSSSSSSQPFSQGLIR